MLVTLMKIIGIGNKARQGKDSFAQIMKERLGKNKVEILHFADALKEEVSNVGEKEPLIYLEDLPSLWSARFWFLNKTKNLSTGEVCNNYSVWRADAFPELFLIFKKRGITTYQRMTEKDSKILQQWGTEYRRNFCGYNYWVDRLEEKIQERKEQNKDLEYILIPDTRFMNEYDFVKSRGGDYIKIVRLNEDGSQYLDPSRDPGHASEIDLDKVQCDHTLECLSEDMIQFRNAAYNLMDEAEYE